MADQGGVWSKSGSALTFVPDKAKRSEVVETVRSASGAVVGFRTNPQGRLFSRFSAAEREAMRKPGVLHEAVPAATIRQRKTKRVSRASVEAWERSQREVQQRY